MADLNATLAGLPLLHGLDEEALRAIAAAGEPMWLAAGDMLIRQGDMGDTLYLLLSGALRVQFSQQRLSAGLATPPAIMPGELAGELALLASLPRSADVVAVEASMLLMFDRVHALGLLGAHPALARRVMAQIATRLAQSPVGAQPSPPGMYERTGEAFEAGAQLTVVGSKLRVGDMAPDFTLDYLDAVGALCTVRLGDSAGAARLLNVVNSLDTPVCQTETRRWEGLQEQLPPGVRLYTVSMDLPYALARWQGQEGITHQLLSAHRSEAFGVRYGTMIKEWRLLQRAVFVIDRLDQVVHAEYVPDQLREPDYEAALKAARLAAG
jgi:thiol peroxidase